MSSTAPPAAPPSLPATTSMIGAMMSEAINNVMSSSGINKRSHSTESLNYNSEVDDSDVAKSAPKKLCGRPRSTQVVSDKTLKRKTKKAKVALSHRQNSTDMSSSANDPQSECSAKIEQIVSHCFESHVVPLTSYINKLQDEVRQLRETVADLVSRVSQLTSLPPPASHAIAINTQPPNVASLPSSLSATSQLASYASTVAAAVPPEHSNSQRHWPIPSKLHSGASDGALSPVTAMYTDQRRRQQRASNIIISGFSQTDNDAAAVTELLRSEFEWDLSDWPGVSVTSCRRLGRHQESKIQPLLVTLNRSHQDGYYVKNAKILRGSSNEAVRDFVYINADLTPSEARAAYELRLQRRERRGQMTQPVNKLNQPIAVFSIALITVLLFILTTLVMMT